MFKIVKKLFITIFLATISYIILIALYQNNVYADQTISSDIDGINESVYPGIKERIKSLQEQYPKWNFQLLYTDIEWKDVITAEYSGHIKETVIYDGTTVNRKTTTNMIDYSSGYRGAWVCNICGEDAPYDNGNWRCASIEAIQYKMDPRNILNANDIFQLEKLSNSGYSVDDLKCITNNTYLSGQEQTIINVANSSNINAYYLAARLIQEQGTSGSSPLANGSGYKGSYVGYYNAFNVNASGGNSSEVITNGLIYAQKKGWDSLEKSIQGGISLLSEKYIGVGQNTLYFQKFDVIVNGGLYNNQYMQNLTAPTTEAYSLKKAYEKTQSFSESHTFVIPMYKNIPSSLYEEPDNNGSSSLHDETMVRVNVNTTLSLRSSPGLSGIKLTSTWLKATDVIYVVEKATSKIDGTYWDKIKTSSGLEAYTARETFDYEGTYKLYLVPIFEHIDVPVVPDSPSDGENSGLGENTENTVIETSKGKAKIQDGKFLVEPNVILENVKEKYAGVTATNDILGTGSKITLNNVEYTVIKLGDVNGDGFVDARDSLRILKYSVGTYELKDEYLQSADINKDGTVDARDSLRILKSSVGTYNITL